MEWQDPSLGDYAFRRVAVFAFATSTAPRRAFEDAIASELTANGLEAISSHSIEPMGGFSEQDVARVIREKRLDGVVTIESADPGLAEAKWTMRTWSARGRYSAQFALNDAIGTVSDAPTTSFVVSLWNVSGMEKNWRQVWAARTDPVATTAATGAAGSVAGPMVDRLMAQLGR